MINHDNFYGDGVDDDDDDGVDGVDGVGGVGVDDNGDDDDFDGGGGDGDDRKLDGRSDKCRPKTLCCRLCCQPGIIIFIVGIIFISSMKTINVIIKIKHGNLHAG